MRDPFAILMLLVLTTGCLTTPAVEPDDDASEADMKSDSRMGTDATPDLTADMNTDAERDVQVERDVGRLQRAENWSAAINVWTFEKEPNLSSDTTLMTGNYTSDSNAIKGDEALGLEAPLVWTASEADYANLDTPVTAGGWMRFDASPTAFTAAVARFDGIGGWGITLDDSNSVTCSVNESPGVFIVATSTPIDQTEWNHVMCTFAGDRVAIYLNGEFIAEDSGTFVDSDTATLTFGGQPGYEFTGALDDIVVENRILSPDAIERIYACGVDGRDCRCERTDPTRYAQCGSFDDCEELAIPCNSDPPP